MFVSLSNICHICTKEAHGNHFGANSCRACAAYFRRAVIKNYKYLKCRRGDGKCELLSKKTYVCKKCRLEKCYQAGMQEKQLQLGRDLLSSTCRQIIPTFEFFVGQPDFIIFCDKEASTSDRNFIDFTKLIEKASNIFTTGSKLYVGMNTLNTLTYATTILGSSKDLKLCSKLGKDDILMFWEKHFLKVATWLTYCDKFQELPLGMRIEFLKAVWMTWTRLQKNSSTANWKLQTNKNDRLCYWADGCIIDADKLDVDISWISNYDKDQFKSYMNPAELFYQTVLIEDLMEFRPSSQEITYMLTVFSFRYAAKSLHGDFEALSDSIIELLADDLHSYYINEMKLMNYAPRVTKMMRMINYIESNFNERREKLKMARLFDMIIVDFSHPEIMYGNKQLFG